MICDEADNFYLNLAGHFEDRLRRLFPDASVYSKRIHDGVVVFVDGPEGDKDIGKIVSEITVPKEGRFFESGQIEVPGIEGWCDASQVERVRAEFTELWEELDRIIEDRREAIIAEWYRRERAGAAEKIQQRLRKLIAEIKKIEKDVAFWAETGEFREGRLESLKIWGDKKDA